MLDPFKIIAEVAASLNLSPWMTIGLFALVAVMIGFSITSLMAGKPMRAVKLTVAGLALLLFFLFSRISGAITGL